MRILAVDDDPLILEILNGVLGQDQRYHLTAMSDPIEALKTLSQGATFDCVLLDIDMPALNGVELCQMIRREAFGQDLSIVMLTALDDKSTIDNAFAAGANDYVNKPIIPSELLARLSNVARLAQVRSLDGADPHPGSGHGLPADCRALHEPFPIPMVDFVIGAEALESYVAKLSKQDLFGSAVFGFSVIGAQSIHRTLSAFDFEALMTDIAEAISDCLYPNQFLMSYVGNGTFLCVTEGGWVPQPKEFACYVERMLRIMEPHDSSGQPITISLASSSLLRLTWKSGRRAVDTLAMAHELAETAAEKTWKERNDPAYWYTSLMRSA